jgi:hypothetical protein
MHKVYYDLLDRDPEVKSETYWSHDSGREKPEYDRFMHEKSRLISVSPIEMADYVMLPVKWSNSLSSLQTNTLLEAKKHNKKIIAFFNDDYDGNIQTPTENFYLFRTSTYASKIRQNEIIMPAFCEEFEYVKPTEKALKNAVISFCGNVRDPHRYHIFAELEKNYNLCKNFLYRNGFWAPEISDKTLARKEFVANVRSGLFGICIRGNGNFSYRLYETLALGRIPIIINSDLKLPLEKVINWQRQAIICESHEIGELHNRIEQYIKNLNVLDICYENKLIYDEYFSPYGLIKHLELYLKETT